MYNEVRIKDLQLHLYFERNLFHIDQLRSLNLASYAQAYANTDIKNELKLHIFNSHEKSVIDDMFIEIEMADSSFNTCKGTIELDCISIRVPSSVKLYGVEPTKNDSMENLRFIFQEYFTKAFLSQRDLLHRLQDNNHEILRNLVKIEARRMRENDDSISIDDSLVYEGPYTSNFYLPMVAFLFINFVASVAGLGLIILNIREERSSDILQLHMQNQNRLAQDATLRTMNDTLHEEILDIDGLVINLGANSDQIELALAD